MGKKIVIVGKGGSGKDHFRKVLENRGLVFGIYHTTRPLRKGEKDGRDYFFTDRDYFEKNREKFFTVTEFNGWIYGISIDQFKDSEFIIMTPSEVKGLDPSVREKCYVIYLDIEESVRKNRLMKRGDSDKTDRRLKRDYIDFLDFREFDLRIDNPKFKVPAGIEKIHGGEK